MKNNKEKDNALSRMKVYKIIMIVIDVVALMFFVYQIFNKNINYVSYLVLLLCNIIVFTFKIK